MYPDLASESPFMLASVLLLYAVITFIFWHTFWAFFSMLQPWNQPFLQGALIPFSQKQYLETML